MTTKRERERIERQAIARHDREAERLGLDNLDDPMDTELAAWIDHHIAEGERIRAHPDCDAAQATILKGLLSMLRQAREGDPGMLRIARMMAVTRP